MPGIVKLSGLTLVDETSGEFVDDVEEFDPLIVIKRKADQKEDESSSSSGAAGGGDDDDEPDGYTPEEIAARRAKALDRWEKKQDNREKRGHEREEFTDWQCSHCGSNPVPNDGDVCDSCIAEIDGDYV